MLPPLSEPSFARYLSHLRWLVDHPSPFTQPDRVGALMTQVRQRLTQFLPDYRTATDLAGNLFALPPYLEPGCPLLFLSAHVDTVPADPSLWTPPFTPHPAFENERELVAQGVNDCKAGVAAELWLAQCAAEGRVALRNLIFTVTFKEEGAGAKSSVTLGRALGDSLPAPTAGSALLVLENTVSSAAPYVPQVYAAENSSFTVRLTGSLAELQGALAELRDWRPVSILPVEPAAPAFAWTRYPPQGHVCSAPPEANPLKAALGAAGEFLWMRAGDERSHGTVPAAIGTATSPERAPPHRLTITKRGNYTFETVSAELAGRDFTAVKPLEISGGFDHTAQCASHPLGQSFLSLAETGEVTFERNIGASDATIITSSMPAAFRPLLLPLVCGPGTRSQRSAQPPRLTHGPNETFVKAAGRRSLSTLWAVLLRAGHLRLVPERR